MPRKPYAASCDQNREPILAVLQAVFTQPGLVLEVGSGTGQHAIHFAPRLPHLVWQPTELPAHLPGIQAWQEEFPAPNLRPPVALDVQHSPWPIGAADYVYTANTVHILSWPGVAALFRGVGQVLLPGGCFALYGPFCSAGVHTAPSNERFDAWLRARDPASGVRDTTELDALAHAAGLVPFADYAMPVNNRILVWNKANGRLIA